MPEGTTAGAAGGRVARTGIALVHEGEYIVPAPGSEAHLSDAGHAVNYHFPVEMHVLGSLPDAEAGTVADLVLDRIVRELGSRL